MIRALSFLGLLIVNAIVAVIGTAILEHAVWRIFPAHSVLGVLWKEWIFSGAFATLIGIGMWRTWRSSVAKWTWVIPALWFTVGVLSATGRGDATGRIFGLHSDSVLSTPDTRSFFTFTVPMIRASFYSVGACISSLLHSPRVVAPSDPLA
jgi:hypothetical protein